MQNFLDLCSKRRSVRSYSDKPVSAEDAAYIAECARLAPSACNRQPWKFLFVSSVDGRKKLQEAYGRDWFAQAPLYIVCMENKEDCWVRAADSRPYGEVDVAIAAEHICLAAADRGLGSCWVANYDPEKLRAFCPDPHFEAVAIITVGYAADDAKAAEKKRKPLSEIAENI